jgi:hypothetical protein
MSKNNQCPGQDSNRSTPDCEKPYRTMALGSTQPLTEMCTRNLPGGKGRPARKADNLTVTCKLIF